MGEYISKAAAINKIMENIVHQDTHEVNLHNIGLRKAMSAIDSLPAADVVEVVRCYECIHHDEERPFHYCRRLRRDCPDDCEFFCAFGKRKDGGPDA